MLVSIRQRLLVNLQVLSLEGPLSVAVPSIGFSHLLSLASVGPVDETGQAIVGLSPVVSKEQASNGNGGSRSGSHQPRLLGCRQDHSLGSLPLRGQGTVSLSQH